MIKRITTLVFVFLAIAGNAVWGQSVWNGTADKSWYVEGQTEFTITTAEQLAGLAELSKYDNDYLSGITIKLGANIVLNNGNCEDWETNATDLHEWNPIGSFNGSFNGQGYTISGLYINIDNDDDQNLGLFGSIGDGSSVQNLKIVNSYIKGKGSFSRAHDVYIGGIVGEIDSRSNSISYCSFDGIISADYSGSISEFAIGGVCGSVVSADGKIAYCYNNADINVNLNNLTENHASYYINGIGAATSVSNSYNAGNIYATINNSKTYTNAIAGISGIVTDITSCYNIGNITLSGNENSEVMAVGGLGGFTSNSLQYCYNTGTISTDEFSISTSQSGFPNALMVGIISGYDLMGNCTFTENYYLPQGNLSAVGESQKEDGLIKTTEDEFKSGKIAHALRENGYGQNLDEYGNAIDQTPVLLCFAGEEQKVYKLTLESDAITEISGDIYRNAEPAKLLQQEVYDKLMADAEEGKDLIWKNTEGEVVAIGNDYTPSTDETLTAEWGDVYTINTVVEPAGAGTILVQAKAQEGDEISFTITANEGYELASVSAGEVSLTEANGSYSFTMPAANVTITATFNKVETEQPGDDDEEDQDNTGIHKPQRPIKYYNIYIDTICPGLNVEVSKDVVQEGHQVSAYLTIQVECDTTGMRFEYKRGLFGYWKDLKELEGVQPGEYIIKNIYTDIYIRALDATLPEEEPTGIDDLEGVKAYAKEGSIYVYTPNREEVTIISMSGAIIKHAEQVGLQSYSVSRGIYIVRVGEKVFKLKN